MTPESTLPSPTAFGETKDGQKAKLYTLDNGRGMVARVTDFGATLVELHVPGRDGESADVVLGFDDVSGYQGEGNQYFGCTTGRVANRIALGRFSLDGETYQLATNNAPNHLHGGNVGLGQRMWTANRVKRVGATGVLFRYTSPAGEEGYPGTLSLQVTYWLTVDNILEIEYSALSDAATPLNLTHHSYFNLGGAGSETVLDHALTIDASKYTACDDTLIPTGELASVVGTPLDFRVEHVIGDRIASLDDTAAIGYDHNFVLRGERGNLRRACKLSDPSSGRSMEIWTTEPGLQLYTGNFLFGQEGKGGKAYPHRSAVCLETQHFPDSINQPNFPSTVLRPGETYTQKTEHRFSVE